MWIATLNGARFEAAQHGPIAVKEGPTEQQVAALANWQASDLFNETQCAVLAYCDAMTRDIRVPDAVFARVRRALPNWEPVKLTATTRAYNMVSRFLKTLQIDHHDDIMAATHARS